MAEQLAAGSGSGTAFAEFTADAVVDALEDAAVNRVELTDRARMLAPHWRRTQSIGAYVDRMLADARRVSG